MNKRIGFACKYSQYLPNKKVITIPEYNLTGTTIAWLNRQPKDRAVEKLWDILKHNLLATEQLIKKVGTFDHSLRMVRLGSDILTAYTHKDWNWFWKQPDVIKYCETNFSKIGIAARNADVRLSMHPGQFCVLASDVPDIVQRSIEEFEYHATMAAWMGFGRSFQDFKINVHIAGRAGPEGIRRAYAQLSPEARNCITIENEEISYGLDDCLSLSNLLPIVLDIHHHWIREGEYIKPEDSRVARVLDSWRGIRPVLHYSVSREDVLVGHHTDILPDYQTLLANGFKKQKLRAHSDFYWNNKVNEWALQFLTTHDLMCESKAKNLASFALADQAKRLNLF